MNTSKPAHSGDYNIAEERSTILVVEDNKLELNAIEMILEKEHVHVVTAQSAEKAIEIMTKIPPAVIISDQSLPGMSGIELLKKAQEIRPDAFRILLTASHDLETVINAINIGQVNQYISKPWQATQLCKTAKSYLEKYKLVIENRVLQDLILNQHKKLKKNHEILRHELKLGAQIHEQLLLGKVPSDVPGFLIKAYSCPSQEIDGDFFEFYRPLPYVLDMVLGDVMGKGIAAALVGTAVKTHLFRFAIPFPLRKYHDKNSGWRDSLLHPESILEHVSNEISQKLIDMEYFVSLFYGRFDLQFKTFCYLDCGSAKPIHYQRENNQITNLAGESFPLGVVKKPHFQLKETTFAEGDIFVFYSDGISEARSPNGTFFGVERIKELVKTNRDLTADALIEIIRRAVASFTKKEKFDDDLTLIVIKIGFYERPQISKYQKTEFCSDLSQLTAVRSFTEGVCRKAPGNSERLSKEMQLVLNEVFCNIIKHGKIEKNKKAVVMSGELLPEGVLFNILDQGAVYDPSDINEPSFSGSRDTGYGWHIIKQLSDCIAYTQKENAEGWNKLTIFKSYYLEESKMKIIHKTEGGVLVITPDGDSLDAKEAPVFKEKVIELINDKELKGVVFDLNRLEFIDSSGLGSFLSVLRHLNTRGGDLRLSRMNKQIRTMFELVKMHKIFEIFNSTEDAVISFK